MSTTPDVFGPANFTNSSTSRPFDGRQFGNTDTWFIDCSGPETEDGTDLGAPWFNAMTANARSIARANGLQRDGLTPVVAQDNRDDLLLRAVQQMIQRNQANFAVDTGVPNVILIQPSITPAELIAGMPFLVLIANTPTGPTTLRIGTFPPFSVRKGGNQQLTGGEFGQGDLQAFAYDGVYIKALGLGAGNAPQLISADLTLTVPEQYPTIRAALLATSTMILRSDAHLKILVDAIGYTETFDPSLGPLIGNHPYGQRITISAPALNIGFPSGDDINAKSNADTLNLLKGRWNATIRTTGGTNLFEIRAGTLNFENLLMYGDGSAGSYGGRVGDWQTTASQGSAGFTNCAFHGFAQDNLEVTDASVARLNNVCSTYAGVAAFRSARTSNITIRTGSMVGMYSGIGLACFKGGEFSADAGSSRLDFRRNTDSGIKATAGGIVAIDTGPATYVRDNGNGGLAFGAGAQIYLPPAVSIGGNSTDLYASDDGYISARGAAVGSTSPYRNNFGNNNGFVAV